MYRIFKPYKPQNRCRYFSTARGIVKRSNLFLPTLRDFNQKEKTIESHKLLIKAGYIRQANLGIYDYLPFGLRVLDKIEELIDVSMNSVHGQKLAMPLLLNADNWKKTGRWDTTGEELFRLKDRHDVMHCLSPTHEEVVTEIVAQNVFSHRDLPLSLYQIGKKYRDERRPRFGPMRAREFIMKDMYSFDKSAEDAFDTYENVRNAYHKMFKALELNYVEVEADSGNIGGNLSHEFHVLNNVGEDLLLTCNNCNYSANVEKARPFLNTSNNDMQAQTYILKGTCLNSETYYACVHAPLVIETKNEIGYTRLNETKIITKWNEALKEEQSTSSSNVTINSYKIVDDIDAGGVLINFIDTSVNLNDVCNSSDASTINVQSDFLLAHDGDHCNACGGKGVLNEKRGIEVGHIFYLGKKYSSILNATYMDSNNKTATIEMGCYGIGVSRILAAAIENKLNDNNKNNTKEQEQSIATSSNKKKNNAVINTDKIIWPSIIAPYQCVILTATNNDTLVEYATELAMKLVDTNINLKNEIIIDDRRKKTFGHKMKEATLWGAPFKIILGKSYLKDGKIEIETCNNVKLYLNEDEVLAYMKDNVQSIEEKYYSL